MICSLNSLKGAYIGSNVGRSLDCSSYQACLSARHICESIVQGLRVMIKRGSLFNVCEAHIVTWKAILGTPVVPFCPFYFGVSLFKLNRRRKGTLIMNGLLGNLV